MQGLLALLSALIGGLLVNYLADVLPATRRLSAPLWWPLTRTSAGDYLRRARVRAVLVFYVLAALVLALFPPMELSASLLFALLLYFGLVSVIDIEHRAVLHPVSLAGALWFAVWGGLRRGWLPTLLGGLAGFIIMLLLYFLGEAFGRWLARRRGEEWEEIALGFGDVNLSAVIGLLLGWPSVMGGLLAGVLAGGVFGAGYVLLMLVQRRYRAFSTIPYAPFLSLGALILIFLRAYSL